ncbi:hypothetical protein H4582DRAFT_1807258, partial [Lactarius indigo]
WQSPPDPSTNHNFASDRQHEGTAEWFIKDDKFGEWKAVGSLLWIHGKPSCGSFHLIPSILEILLSLTSSAIINDVTTLCRDRSASMAYFYFDFRDTNKQARRNLLSSFLTQLSNCSANFCDILSRLYKAHGDGARQPSDSVLLQCLKEMLTLPDQGPVYLIMDALDECPDTSDVPSPREQLLDILKDLVGLRIPSLHICATSRPEEKEHVIETLSERADGMFRWVFCQLETLRNCLPQNVRSVLKELPKSLDETYERMLKEIGKVNPHQAHRILQCLAVATRPLRVEELAEVLALDFDGAVDGIPALNKDWRWDDDQQGVLSTCSSLIVIVDGVDEDSWFRTHRVVQFAHFSVKEFLTSDRLACLEADISRFHIRLEPSHIVISQACLAILLQSDYDDRTDNTSPLLEYAARHWVVHAQFGSVSMRVEDGIRRLFDPGTPHFEAWLRSHIIDKQWLSGSTPLHVASSKGDAEILQLLIAHGADVHAQDGNRSTPLHLASSMGSTEAVRLLIEHGADVNAWDRNHKTPLHLAFSPVSAKVLILFM